MIAVKVIFLHSILVTSLMCDLYFVVFSHNKQSLGNHNCPFPWINMTLQKVHMFFHLQISNTEGELYCLSIRSRRIRWIQDFSSLDKVFTITPGNNGHLYVTVPVRALVLALDVFSGNILWQKSIGPLSKADCAPAVDSNG